MKEQNRNIRLVELEAEGEVRNELPIRGLWKFIFTLIGVLIFYNIMLVILKWKKLKLKVQSLAEMS